MKSKSLSDQQACWAAYLASFFFVIKHIPGKQNPANPASRCPDYLPEVEEVDTKHQMFVDTPERLLLKEGQKLDTGLDVDLGEGTTLLTTKSPETTMDTDFFLFPLWQSSKPCCARLM
jgi:hypothetical protein